MSNADSDDIEWWSEAPDPREGVDQALLFFVEALLAPAIILRVGAHTVAEMALTGTDEPDVDTGLRLGWAVRDSDVKRSDQLAIAAIWGMFIGGGYLWTEALGSIGHPTVAVIAAANWLYVAGDAAWLVADWSLSVLR